MSYRSCNTGISYFKKYNRGAGHTTLFGELADNIQNMRSRHAKLTQEASSAGISSQDMQSLEGKQEDAKLMLTSHYYHYLMWTILAITLIAFVVRVLSGNSNQPTNAITMIIIIIAFFFVVRGVYHYLSTHSIIFR